MPASLQQNRHPSESVIEESQWALYEAAIDAATEAGIPFALGGALALATYTGTARNTKDLDLYVLPSNRARMIDVVTRLGLSDYFDRVPYDRHWIYRAVSGDTIIDIIWAMANRRADADEWWLSGPFVKLRGRTVKVLPAETLLWDKLYILQRERCDWPDVLNLLYYRGEHLAWRQVLDRLQEDLPLLGGALSVFRWLSPGKASKLPDWLWPAVNLPACENSNPEIVPERVGRLDRRPWYAQNKDFDHA